MKLSPVQPPEQPRTWQAMTRVILSTFVLTGCETAMSPGAERGPQGTYAYNVPIEASEPGTKIEVNYQVVGTAPLTVKIFGDRDGTFHNFGSDEYTVRGYPPGTNQYPQTKIFRTGAFSIKDDKIPAKIFFDFGTGNPKPR